MGGGGGGGPWTRSVGRSMDWGSVFSGHPNFGIASERFLRGHYRVSLTLLSILAYILMKKRNKKYVYRRTSRSSGGSPSGVGGQERNEVNHVTGEGGSYIGS